MKIFERRNDLEHMTATQYYLADLAFDQGNLLEAAELYEKTVEAFKNSPDTTALATPKSGLARVKLLLGDSQAARKLYLEAFDHLKSLDLRYAMTRSICGLASVHLYENRPHRAAELLAAVVEFRRQLGNIRQQDLRQQDELLTLLREQLDETAISEPWERGSALSWDELLECTLTD